MIEAAERDGQLRPGGTIVEPTSGNTGTGLAIAARLKGYRVIAVMPDKMSKEKIDLLRAYGAEVVVAPTDVAPDSPRVLLPGRRPAGRGDPRRLPAQPVLQPGQPAPRTTRSTGPELWEQTGGRITHLVVGVGTGGTITGIGRYLKERNPAIEVIGADPVGSIYSADEVKPYLVEGVGEDFWPETFDPLDRRPLGHGVRPDAFLTTRRLAAEEGILAGGSCGMARPRRARGRARDRRPRGARRRDPPRRRALLPVEGLQRRVDDPVRLPRARETDQTVGDVLRAQGRRRRHPAARHGRRRTTGSATRSRCCTSTASRSCRSSARTTRTRSSARSASAACCATPSTDPPLLGAEVVDVMEPPFPAVAADDAVSEAVALLAGERQALLVTVDGRPAGIVTRADLLEALAR